MMWKVVVTVLAALLAVGFGALVGGYTDIDINDENAQNALAVAVKEHNRRSNHMYRSQAAEVIRVQRQVVAGLNYKITVRMARTTCRNSNQECTPNPESAVPQSYQCTFFVWARPWLSDIQMTKERCETDNS